VVGIYTQACVVAYRIPILSYRHTGSQPCFASPVPIVLLNTPPHIPTHISTNVHGGSPKQFKQVVWCGQFGLIPLFPIALHPQQQHPLVEPMPCPYNPELTIYAFTHYQNSFAFDSDWNLSLGFVFIGIYNLYL
jgi:hypothetical protein